MTDKEMEKEIELALSWKPFYETRWFRAIQLICMGIVGSVFVLLAMNISGPLDLLFIGFFVWLWFKDFK